MDLRELLNPIRYMARSGSDWCMLPVHFGPWQTLYWWFRHLVRRLLFQRVRDVRLMLDREQMGREANPTVGVVDSAFTDLGTTLGDGHGDTLNLCRLHGW